MYYKVILRCNITNIHFRRKSLAYDYETTHNNILKSAKKHFKKYGFREASIRNLCKDAGVTNGAFYAHFKSKEDLFDSLVCPCIKEFNSLYTEEEEGFFEIKNSTDIIKAFTQSYKSTDNLINFICSHKDIFLLILESSGGTSWENFEASLIKEESKNMKSFFELCKPFVKNPQNISDSAIGLGSSFFITSILNSFKRGLSAQEIIKESREVSEFCIGGYKQLLGI